MNKSIFKSLVAMILNSIADMIPEGTSLTIYKGEDYFTIYTNGFKYTRMGAEETISITEDYDNE